LTQTALRPSFTTTSIILFALEKYLLPLNFSLFRTSFSKKDWGFFSSLVGRGGGGGPQVGAPSPHPLNEFGRNTSHPSFILGLHFPLQARPHSNFFRFAPILSKKVPSFTRKDLSVPRRTSLTFLLLSLVDPPTSDGGIFLDAWCAVYFQISQLQQMIPSSARLLAERRVAAVSVLLPFFRIVFPKSQGQEFRSFSSPNFQKPGSTPACSPQKKTKT